MARLPRWKSALNTEVNEQDDWLVTYADAITLLMAFFVTLFSISKIEQRAFDNLKDAIQNRTGKQLVEPDPDPMPTTRATRGTSQDLHERLLPLEAVGQVLVTRNESGLTMDIPSDELFLSGSGSINPQQLYLVESIAEKLSSTDLRGLAVMVEGHTDSSPSPSPGNWTLSAMRAAAVLQVLADEGIDKKHLSLAGYGETRPKVDERDEDGALLPEMQAQNRRIVIRVENPHGQGPRVPLPQK